MRNRILLFLLFSSCAVTGASAQAARSTEQLPAWLKQKIALLEKDSKKSDVVAISKLQYKNQDAYLFQAPCCDRFDNLYDAAGKVICAPTGGFTGRGDGRCPDLKLQDVQLVPVWRHKEPAK